MENQNTRKEFKKKISELGNEQFLVVRLFSSVLESEKEIRVNGLMNSSSRAEDIGVIDFISVLTRDINLIIKERE